MKPKDPHNMCSSAQAHPQSSFPEPLVTDIQSCPFHDQVPIHHCSWVSVQPSLIPPLLHLKELWVHCPQPCPLEGFPFTIFLQSHTAGDCMVAAVRFQLLSTVNQARVLFSISGETIIDQRYNRGKGINATSVGNIESRAPDHVIYLVVVFGVFFFWDTNLVPNKPLLLHTDLLLSLFYCLFQGISF